MGKATGARICVGFWRLERRFELTRRICCYYPPRASIFAWSLAKYARNRPRPRRPKQISSIMDHCSGFSPRLPLSRISPVCMKEVCNLTRNFCHITSYLEASALPDLPKDIHQYYKATLKNCRAESPDDRSPARQILERYPTMYEIQSTPSASSTSGTTIACSNTNSQEEAY